MPRKVSRKETHRMKAFLVFGPESAGTKFLAGLLQDGGCHGSDTHEQPFDTWEFGNQTPIVWRRSFPHTPYHLWPNIELDILKPLRAHGYSDVVILVISRDWCSLWQSQVDPKNG